MNDANNQGYLSAAVTPVQAFKDLSLERESFDPPSFAKKSNGKRKRGSDASVSASMESSLETSSIDEDELRRKLSAHFTLLHDIKENRRLRGELERATSSLQLHEGYKQQQKRKVSRLKSKTVR